MGAILVKIPESHNNKNSQNKVLEEIQVKFRKESLKESQRKTLTKPPEESLEKTLTNSVKNPADAERCQLVRNKKNKADLLLLPPMHAELFSSTKISRFHGLQV